MRRHRFSTIAVLAASVMAMGWTVQATAPSANNDYRLTGPYMHNNWDLSDTPRRQRQGTRAAHLGRGDGTGLGHGLRNW